MIRSDGNMLLILFLFWHTKTARPYVIRLLLGSVHVIWNHLCMTGHIEPHLHVRVCLASNTICMFQFLQCRLSLASCSCHQDRKAVQKVSSHVPSADQPDIYCHANACTVTCTSTILLEIAQLIDLLVLILLISMPLLNLNFNLTQLTQCPIHVYKTNAIVPVRRAGASSIMLTTES